MSGERAAGADRPRPGRQTGEGQRRGVCGFRHGGATDRPQEPLRLEKHQGR